MHQKDAKEEGYGKANRGRYIICTPVENVTINEFLGTRCVRKVHDDIDNDIDNPHGHRVGSLENVNRDTANEKIEENEGGVDNSEMCDGKYIGLVVTREHIVVPSVDPKENRHDRMK